MQCVNRYIKRFWIIWLALLLLCACNNEPEFYSIGVGRDDIQPAFEEAGFVFKGDESVYGQPQIIGFSADGLDMVQLIGPADDLVTARVMVHLPNGITKPQMNRKRGYLETLMNLVMPDWGDGMDWVGKQAIKQGGRTSGGSSHTEVEGIEVTVRVRTKDNVLALVFGDWCTGIGFDVDEGEWRTH